MESASLTYAWTQTSGTTVTLSDATAASPTFTAPATTDHLEFTLTVTDGDGATSEAYVPIEVINRAPVAVATASAMDAAVGEER